MKKIVLDVNAAEAAEGGKHWLSPSRLTPQQRLAAEVRRLNEKPAQKPQTPLPAKRNRA